MTRQQIRRLALIPLAILIALVLYRMKGLFVAALVNGRPISRIEVVSNLEKQGGKNVLDNLITNELVLQEAKKQKVTVTQTDIDNEIKKISENVKAQGQDLDQLLSLQGMTKKDLENQIKLQIIVQKILGKDITVDDKEAQDYFEKNKTSFGENAKYEDVKEEIVNQLKQQKLGEKVNSWLTTLKSQAKIDYFVSY